LLRVTLSARDTEQRIFINSTAMFATHTIPLSENIFGNADKLTWHEWPIMLSNSENHVPQKAKQCASAQKANGRHIQPNPINTSRPSSEAL
jgi:hypothetical protein